MLSRLDSIPRLFFSLPSCHFVAALAVSVVLYGVAVFRPVLAFAGLTAGVNGIIAPKASLLTQQRTYPFFAG